MSYTEVPAKKCEYGCATHLRNAGYRQAHIMDGNLLQDRILDGTLPDGSGCFKIAMLSTELSWLDFKLAASLPRPRWGVIHRVALLHFDEQRSGPLTMPSWWWPVAVEIGNTWQRNLWSTQNLRVGVTF